MCRATTSTSSRRTRRPPPRPCATGLPDSRDQAHPTFTPRRGATPMQIVMLTVGSHGDVQPFVLLGRALRARGHSVAVATGTDFRGYVEDAGLAYRPLGSDLAEYAANLFLNPKV